jgi:hypothetical protein
MEIKHRWIINGVCIGVDGQEKEGGREVMTDEESRQTASGQH